MVEVSASLLDVKQEDVLQKIYNLEVAKIDSFHMDVMDGKFVEKDTSVQMKEYAEYVKQISNLPLEVHLMVEDVENYIKSYLALEPYMIIFHVEACANEQEVRTQIQQIQENNVKVGICINPGTPVQKVYPYLPYIHRVLVMTVQPGKGGQSILPETIQKIKELSRYVYDNGFEVDIEADGGINGSTIEQVIKAGINRVVSGSYLAKASNPQQAVQYLKQV